MSFYFVVRVYTVDNIIIIFKHDFMSLILLTTDTDNVGFEIYQMAGWLTCYV
jgi:hypothetical protein